MRAVVQRVKSAAVTLQESGEQVGRIDRGYVVLLGVGTADTADDASYLAEKVAHLRIFDDPDGKMNLSILDVGGAVLAVSQFTLYGDCRRGRRPGFTEAARPEAADQLYMQFVQELEGFGLTVATGVFQTDMLVELANDGPVTILLDSKKEF